MIYIGIDPGFSGAMVAIDGESRVIASAIEYKDETSMFDAFRKMYGPIVVRSGPVVFVIERVNVRPAFGASAAFNFGRAYGAALMLPAHLYISSVLVTPQKWRAAMLSATDAPKKKDGKPDWKKCARVQAARLWPDAPHLFDAGWCDAALIAEWLRRQEQSRGHEKSSERP